MSEKAVMARQQELKELEEQLRTLPYPYQQMMHLHYIEGKTYREIAVMLIVPKGTVKSYINRGKKRLTQMSYKDKKEAC